ncbi:MAG: hypothetical protein CSA65_06955 [Proteobacteria bacterium]|nr:MAG: hypothetical protein CSB49_05400 [Pseudomonadota bacterium]PIE17887.1 MAG: hypothetical protein CSA65_06955 [Pseudomonadota bacterium]
MKRWTLSLVIVASLLLAAGTSEAQVLNPALAGSVKAKKIYRGSLLTYENIFSLRALDPGAEQSYTPYYAQSITFAPQIWLRDDMFVSARMSVEVEVTDSQWTDTKREPILSDLFFNYMWLSAYRIPVVGISISPTIRLRLPTSKTSQAQSMMFSIEPGVLFSKSFKLHKGTWFSSIALMYGFRVSPRFHEFETAQIDQVRCSAGGGAIDSAGGPTPTECLTSGVRNSKLRFANSFILRINVHPKVFFTASVALINDMLYEGSETEDQFGNPIPATEHNHNALVSSSIVVTIPLMRWLFFSTGFTSFHNQLEPDSTRFVPLFNRNINFFFDVTIPIDKFVDLVSS